MSFGAGSVEEGEMGHCPAVDPLTRDVGLYIAQDTRFFPFTTCSHNGGAGHRESGDNLEGTSFKMSPLKRVT